MFLRAVSTVVILLASFYAWLMTATGLQLTQYRPAFGGWIGNAQPYVLAALVHAAITMFYLRLASPIAMSRREQVSMAMAAPLILVFAVWAVFMSSYSIMFERRDANARSGAANHLTALAGELRSIDQQMTTQFLSWQTNLDQRLEREINDPEPGVARGCGPRCRDIRAARIQLENFQHLRTPILGTAPPPPIAELAETLGTRETEYQQVTTRYSDWGEAVAVFTHLNELLLRQYPGVPTVGEAGATSQQTRLLGGRLKAVHESLVDMRENDRNLTDSKFRGLTEVVKDIGSAWASGKVAQVIDLSTILLIALAPDIISVAMALMARTFTPVPTEPDARLPWGMMLWKNVMRTRRRLPSGLEVDNLKSLVTEQLRYRVHSAGQEPPTERTKADGGIRGTSPHLVPVTPSRPPPSRRDPFSS